MEFRTKERKTHQLKETHLSADSGDDLLVVLLDLGQLLPQDAAWGRPRKGDPNWLKEIKGTDEANKTASNTKPPCS